MLLVIDIVSRFHDPVRTGLKHIGRVVIFLVLPLVPRAQPGPERAIDVREEYMVVARVSTGQPKAVHLFNPSSERRRGFLYGFDVTENVFVRLSLASADTIITEYRWSYTPFQQFQLYPIQLAAGTSIEIRFNAPFTTDIKWVQDAATIPRHEPTLQNEIEGNYVELVICGMMFMMWLYITLKFLQLRTKEYFFYSLTILFSLLHFVAVLLAKVSVDWYSHPIEREFYHRFFQTLSHVAYFQFFRHFTQTYRDQPRFDCVLQIGSAFALGYIAVDTGLVFAVVSAQPLELWWVYVRIAFVMFVIASLVFWVSQSRSPLRNYLIAGNVFLVAGGVLTMVFNPYRGWIESWWPPFAYPLFYYRAGVLLEVICFSLGLGYKQKLDDKKRAAVESDLQREQLELAKARELDAVKSSFFANISHEFRTPLTLIQAPADQILARGGAEFEKEVRLIKNNSDTLLRLINQVLELTRLEAGRWQLQVQEVHLRSFIDRVTEPFAYLAAQRGQAWNVTSPPAGVTAFLDADAVEKIVNNLAGNAIKHAGEGAAIALKICIQGQDLVIQLSDTGRGVAPHLLPHIFDRYNRAEATTEGFGIGLAHTRELVRYHHGTIEARSPSGQGVTFTVRLPHRKESYPAEEQKPDQPHESIATAMEKSGPGKPLLFLVEDHNDLREFLKSLLCDAYDVRVFADASEAWKQAQHAVPDLVLSDWMMPGMSGLELCQQIKNAEATNHIPVVLLTARASDHARIEGWQTGADDYIVKPFDSDELLLRVSNLIRQRQLLFDKFRAQSTVAAEGLEAPQEKFMARVRGAIEAHLEQSAFSVDDLAEAVALSRVQLHRKLTAVVGQSPAEYVRNYRLDRAAAMLKAEVGNVAEVAWKTGFESQSHFARVYRERFGHPPSQTPRSNAKKRN